MNDLTRHMVTVIVVDDQPLERVGNALILDSDDNIKVVGEAASGEEAIPLILREKPDVVLMDVRMPGIGGIEATKILTTAQPTTKVIVLTTFNLDEYAFGSLRAGASAFLLKSTKPEALVAAVKTVASGAAVVDPGLTVKLIDHFVSTQPAARKSEANDDRLRELTPRESDVFAAIVRGLSNTEISKELRLAETTVKSHINSIFAKLHLRDRVHAVILGYEIWPDLPR
ncbi:response regulator [Microbacterium sp. A93]|uniref:response regulator n=1 Tax=Microbacterium sp. A93 TaxID=3450716 RepID=UPI003F41F2B7